MSISPSRLLPEATRTHALTRLQRFVPYAGRAYASGRNYDLPDEGHPYVSQLSPYLRCRLITEEEVVQAVLGQHSFKSAEKFVQEVFWRTYWKGWLEMRPSVWSEYVGQVHDIGQQVDRAPDLQLRLRQAEAGATDIEAFNDWVTELTDTGYLHNHARMWFASIWIFTLDLPWQLGADFFMRHLLDGDPASNTLSWRWVAGLQTQGKAYIARSSNISKYTKGRHNPEWRLNTQAHALSGPQHSRPQPVPAGDLPDPGCRSVVLLHEDDLSPGPIFDLRDLDLVGLCGLLASDGRSPRGVAAPVRAFATAALEDSQTRWGGRAGGTGPVCQEVETIAAWVTQIGAEQVITPYAPVGPTASALKRLEQRLNPHGIRLVRVQKPWDRDAWPFATKGFFQVQRGYSAAHWISLWISDKNVSLVR